MAAVAKVMDRIVILDDDDDAEEPSSSSCRPQTSCMSRTSNVPQPPTHIPDSPFASARKEGHVLKLENEKLFGEFLDHCVEHTREHPEVVSFLNMKYSKASPDFLMSVEFRNAVGRCLTRAQAQSTKTFVYINELCTILKQHSTKRRAVIQPSNAKKQEKIESREEQEEKGNADVQDESASQQLEAGEEQRKTKRASRRQIAYLENLLKVYSDEIRRLQERELSLEDLEQEDSSYIQEHKLKRKLMKIYDKLCELKDCSTLTGRVMEQRIHYSGTRYPEINKKIERFINQPEVRQNPPDYRDILQVVKRANERNKLMLSRKQESQIAQEAFRETGNMLQDRRHLDMIYNFGSPLTDFYKPATDPALTDGLLAQKLRSNRELALHSLEEVINKYASKQDDTEEEERRKRLEKEKQKKEEKRNGQQESIKAENSDKSGDEIENEEEEEEDEEEEEEDSSDPDIEEEIQASAAQVRPDDEDNEEEHLSIGDDVVPPSSVGSCLSVKSPGCGDAGESGDEVPRSDSRTCESVTADKSPEDKRPSDSPSSSNSRSQSGVLVDAQSGEDVLLTSNSCPSADSNSISEATEMPQICVATPLMTPSSCPEVTDEAPNNKKRKRESKRNHIIAQNGSIRWSDVSDGEVSQDKVTCSPVRVDSTQADTPTQDMVSSSRSTPPPKKHKVNVATQCDPDEVIVLSDSD